jgi:hypothetical protein
MEELKEKITCLLICTNTHKKNLKHVSFKLLIQFMYQGQNQQNKIVGRLYQYIKSEIRSIQRQRDKIIKFVLQNLHKIAECKIKILFRIFSKKPHSRFRKGRSYIDSVFN